MTMRFIPETTYSLLLYNFHSLTKTSKFSRLSKTLHYPLFVLFILCILPAFPTLTNLISHPHSYKPFKDCPFWSLKNTIQHTLSSIFKLQGRETISNLSTLQALQKASCGSDSISSSLYVFKHYNS